MKDEVKVIHKMKRDLIPSLLDEYHEKFSLLLSADAKDVDGVSLKDRERRYISGALLRYVSTINLISEIYDREKISKVLDIGASFGHMDFIIKKLFNFNVYAIDIQQSTHEQLRKILENEGIRYSFCNILNQPIPFQEGSFDLVLFCDVIEHLPINPSPIFHEIRRVLRSERNLILTTDNVCQLQNICLLLLKRNILEEIHSDETWQKFYWRHFRYYSLSECVALLQESGFAIIRACYINASKKNGRALTLNVLTKVYPPFRDHFLIWAKKK
jgi:SAM-dependent methyltransferase